MASLRVVLFPIMRVFSICSRKGGTGKSTLAIHLASLAALPDRPVLLLDADPQRSMSWWWHTRASSSPALIECSGAELRRIVDAARRERVATIIVDTAPSIEQSIAEAIGVADTVLVPTRPTALDLAGAAATLAIAKTTGKRTIAVLNQAPPRTNDREPSIVTEARSVLRGMGADVADAVISARVAFSYSLLAGLAVTEYQPGGRAAGEIEALWQEIS